MPRLKADLARIFAADLVLRWAYQMGKSPLLPLFAAALGAAEMMTGLIVAVSTFTGMILKPLFGMLSDRSGRRLWLLIALAIFVTTPFLYQFVSTPEGLFALRLFHGFATAIFGPVSLAYVADLANENRATRLAVFGMARALASFGAPLCAGLALTYFQPEQVFVLIGFMSLAATVPLMLLAEDQIVSRKQPLRFRLHALASIRHSLQTNALWFAGFLELTVFLVTFAVKAFLPLFILSQDGGTVLQAGLFFSLQEGVHILFRPVGGQLADKKGNDFAIASGLGLLAVGLIMLPLPNGLLILLAAIILGIAQAMVLPASVALLAAGTAPGHRGAGMGFYGALRNLGKVGGPVIAGALLTVFSFSTVFYGYGVLIGLVALAAWARPVLKAHSRSL
jgi:MFS family permease